MMKNLKNWKNKLKIISILINFLYLISSIILTLKFSRYGLSLEDYCEKYSGNKTITDLGLFFVFVVLPFFLVAKLKADCWDFLPFGTVIISVICFFKIYYYMNDNFFENEEIKKTMAIVKGKNSNNSNTTLDVKYRMSNYSIIKKIKVDGNAYSLKNKGDLVIVKYIEGCPSMVRLHNAYPSKKELEKYK